MFDDDDDAMDGGAATITTPILISAPAEITRPLRVSLKDLYQGTVKHLKVGRRLLNGSTEDKVLDIHIHPGWKSGTKIRFARAGNEQPSGESQDLVFVVEEKPEDNFSREGNDLICKVPIPLLEALTGSPGKKIVELLDGRKLQITVPSGISKGDLIVKWDVVFPERLTSAQKEGLKKVLG
ncbi:hypothetical protein CPB85DRAFT_1319446 [Mucidula mucida]|nr:hypothetical protein CPB85DRAFT_1319446 [Mucidula mucida]